MKKAMNSDRFFDGLPEGAKETFHQIEENARRLTLLNLMGEVMERQDRLERGNRRMKWVGAVTVLGLAAVVLMGQTVSGKVIKAEEIVLQDERGRSVATLGADADGKVRLALADKGEKVRAMLSVGADGTPGLVLYDKSERQRATMGVKPDGMPFLAFHGNDQKLRAGFDVRSDGSLALALSDENGVVRIALGMYADGLPMISLVNGGGEVSISVSPFGSPAVALHGKNGYIWSAP